MRITRGDGLITRAEAAELCGVTTPTISQWMLRGYVVVLHVNGEKIKRRYFLPVAKREDGLILLDPVEVAKAENATRKAARRVVVRDLPAAA